MSELLKQTDKLWSGQASTAEPAFHPFAPLRVLEELAPGVAFYKGFVNITGVKTGEGLVLVDTGSYHPVAHKRSFDSLRGWNRERLHTAVYTHGHVDHAYGLPPFLAEARERGWAAPRIVGHVNVLPRMRRYVDTAGYNSIINSRQFAAETQWPVEYQAPTDTYAEALALDDRRHALRTASRQGRDRRPHLGLAAGHEDPVHRRPVHLGGAQRGQSAEGAALRRGMGSGAARDGRARARAAAARARAADRRRGAGARGAHRYRDLPGVAGAPDARAAERRPDHLRDRRRGAPTRRAGGEALSAARVRRARVHRAQPVALLRRLVQRRAERTEAVAAQRAGAGSG